MINKNIYYIPLWSISSDIYKWLALLVTFRASRHWEYIDVSFIIYSHSIHYNSLMQWEHCGYDSWFRHNILSVVCRNRIFYADVCHHWRFLCWRLSPLPSVIHLTFVTFERLLHWQFFPIRKVLSLSCR